MNTVYRIIAYCTLLMVFIGCEELLGSIDSIAVYNYSNHRINYYPAMITESAYPDTLIVETKFTRHINPGGNLVFELRPSYEEAFKRLPADTMSFFIFHTDTLESNSWEAIFNEYKVLKRYDLSLEDVQSLNYTIPYPPTEQMKDMRMYPPYEE